MFYDPAPPPPVNYNDKQQKNHLGPTPPASPSHHHYIQSFDNSTFGLRGLLDQKYHIDNKDKDREDDYGSPHMHTPIPAPQSYFDRHYIGQENINREILVSPISFDQMGRGSPMHQQAYFEQESCMSPMDRPSSAPIVSSHLHLPQPPSSLFMAPYGAHDHFHRPQMMMESGSPRVASLQHGYYESPSLRVHDMQFRYPTPPPRPISTPLYTPMTTPYHRPSPKSNYIDRDINVELALQGELVLKPNVSIQDDIPDEEKYVRVYKCPKRFCSKIYKNSNGLKYHLERGVCELDSTDPDVDTTEAAAVASASNNSQLKIISKPYWCRVQNCGKKYKNLNGLKYHARVAHHGLDFPSMVKGHHSFSPEMDNSQPE